MIPEEQITLSKEGLSLVWKLALLSACGGAFDWIRQFSNGKEAWRYTCGEWSIWLEKSCGDFGEGTGFGCGDGTGLGGSDSKTGSGFGDGHRQGDGDGNGWEGSGFGCGNDFADGEGSGHNGYDLTVWHSGIRYDTETIKEEASLIIHGVGK